jgi:hypothetical protein
LRSIVVLIVLLIAMPVNGPATLLSTIDQFLSHWEMLDRLVAPQSPLVVLEDLPRAGLVALREALLAVPAAVDAAVLEEKLVRGREREMRPHLAFIMKRFNRMVRGNFPGTRFERLLQGMPGMEVAFFDFAVPVHVTQWLWARIEEASDGGGFRLLTERGEWIGSAELALDLAAFIAAHMDTVTAQTMADLARADRDILQERAVAVMKAYGHAVKARVGDGSRLAASLPQLWPGPRRGSRRKKAATPTA